MTAHHKHLRAANTSLHEGFKQYGLDVAHVWSPTPDDPALENRQLAHLLDWVMTYRAHPDRRRMEGMGYEFPPVEPDIDPDSDWIRFERWIRGEPLQWHFEDTYGQLPALTTMSDEETETETHKVTTFLAERGIEVDLRWSAPVRVKYMFLDKLLRGAAFDYTNEDSTCIIGCDSYCPECLQRPWCEMGLDFDWNGEDRNGRKAVPAELLPFVSRDTFIAIDRRPE